jgi:FlaA1/EpsC-like NDP-sugar epimerase
MARTRDLGADALPAHAGGRARAGDGEVELRPVFAALPVAGLRAGGHAADPAGLLARAPHAGLAGPVAAAYAGRAILVTGAGGSIGSELCRQVLACRPRRLVLFELAEHALFRLCRTLAADPAAAAVEIVPVLGSVAEPRLVQGALRANGVKIVLHAAAYKHVPLVEANAVSGLANNVLATRTLAREAAAAGVDRFILVSSDKAVRPVGVMGASKRIAELVIQDLAARGAATTFAAVRFGNVLGSSGSVTEVFGDQIAAGGPLTLTDPEATRYFMTVEEAVSLVLAAGAAATGGAIYALDMGRPVRIADLARKLIEASGKSVRDAATPGGDIAIEITGLRPGERRHEVAMTKGAVPSGIHPAILRVPAPALPELALASLMQAIRAAVAAGSAEAARRAVARLPDEGCNDQAAAPRRAGPF